jgi:hypothetical protein
MLLIKHIHNSVSGFKQSDIILEKWAGLTLAELAPKQCCGAIYQNHAYPIDGKEFYELIPADETQVVFLTLDQGGGDDQAAIISILTGDFLGFLYYSGGREAVGTFFNFLSPKLPGGPSPTTGTGGANFGYNINNQTGNNIPLPVVYGKLRVGGVVAQLYTRFNGDGDEVLHYVLVLSEGPIQAIGQYTSDRNNLTGTNVPDSLKFDDLQGVDLDDLNVSLRLGSSSQTVMPGFESQITRYTQNFTLEQNKNFVWKTQERCHSLDLNISFPQGLRYTDPKNGKTSRESIFLTIEVFSEDGSRLITTEQFTYSRNKSGFFGTTKTVSFPNYGKYLVRVRRTNAEDYLDKQNHQDQAVLSAVNEVRNFAIAHRNRALMGITVVASQQLNGGLPRTSVVIKGRKVDGTWTRNNSLCLQDWLKNVRYSLGSKVSATDLDAIAFTAFQEQSDELIDPWTGAPACSTPESDGANTSTAAPVITGTWTSTTRFGGFTAEVTARTPGTSVTIRYRFTPDDDSAGSVEDFTITHNSGSPSVIAYGISAQIDHLATFVVGDKWTFRVLKEPRHRCDLVIDGRNSAYSVALEMAKSARANLYPVGSLFTIDLLTQKAVLGGLYVEGGNMERDTLSVSVESLLNRSNVIEVDYVDAENDYEQNKVTVEIDSLVTSNVEPTVLNASLIGVTRKTEAARYADFLKRVENNQRESVTFRSGIDAIALFPGQVFKASVPNRLNSKTGRIISSVASTSVVLDQEITFYPNTIYVFVERAQDDSIVQTEFDVPSQTTTNTINVAPADADSTGNIFVVGEKDVESKLYICTGVRSEGSSESRTISGVIYSDYIYGDDAPPRAFSFVTPDVGNAPANVTDLAVVETVADNRSTLTVSWTASAGAPAAASYNVYMREAGGSYVLIDSVTGTSASTVQILETGSVVNFAIQPVSAIGASNVLSSVSNISYVIRRKGNTLIVFPGNVTNLVITPGSGNNATLSWSAVSGVTGYEVRIGGWLGGIVLSSGTSTSRAIKLNNCAQIYHVRAYNTIGGERFYSPEDTNVTSTPTTLTGYTVEKSNQLYDFASEGTFQNCTALDWISAQSTSSVLQLSQDAPLRWETPVVDLGSGAATHVSLDARCASYYISNSDDLTFDMDHFSFDGEINADYFTIKYFLLVSDNGVAYSSSLISDRMNEDIITFSSRRYFKVAVEISLKNQTGQADLRPVLGQIRQLRLALHRAT